MKVKVEIVNGKIKVYYGMFLSSERKLLQHLAEGLPDGVHYLNLKKEALKNGK